MWPLISSSKALEKGQMGLQISLEVLAQLVVLSGSIRNLTDVKRLT